MVATELAVFLRVDKCAGGDVLSLSLEPELRDSHENGLVSLRVGGGGGAGWLAAAAVEGGGLGLFAGASVFGDQGIEGSALVRPLNDKLFDEGSLGTSSLPESSAARRSVAAGCRSSCG